MQLNKLLNITINYELTNLPKVDEIEVKGKVLTALPNSIFKVKLIEQNIEINVRLAGKVRKHRVRILPGDIVIIALSTSDLTQGRITYRSKAETVAETTS